MASKTANKAVARRVDYTSDEMRAAADLARKAGRAYQSHVRKGEGTILVQCVEATREAVHTGYLVDGREVSGDSPAVSGKTYAGFFGLSSGSEVTFWKTLALALDAGVTVGDPLWLRLATRHGEHGSLLAKRADVKAVIVAGGSLADISAACDTAVKAAKRTPRPAAEKGAGESPESGIVPSEDPVADAHLAIRGLDAALKRFPHDDDGYKAFRAVKAELAALMRRETTLRSPKPGKVVKAA